MTEQRLQTQAARSKIIALALLLWVLSGCVNSQLLVQARRGPAKLEALRAPGTLFPNTEVRHPAHPVRLQIPRLGVDANIEAVGRDKNGAMQTPARPQDVGWYDLGAAPGAMGNAVLAGHLNQPGNKPAVFWDLKKLEPGDEVTVIDGDDVAWTFRVERVTPYPQEEAPIEEIFIFEPGRRLNLITCSGRWNKSNRTYTERLVVYAVFDSFHLPKD